MLMLLYVDDLVPLAPSLTVLKTALMERERVARTWRMAVNYPKTEAVVFCPARCCRRHHPSWIQQRGSQASAQVTGGRTRSSRGVCAQQGRSSHPTSHSVLL